MNCSELKSAIYSYLGFKGVQPSDRVDGLISTCLEELETLSQFNYEYRLFEDIPKFLDKLPYKNFLSGCTQVILCITTLGAEVDKRIKYLGKVDLEKCVVFDACASAYLEYRADSFERGLGENLTYRFCPGYGGSDIGDLKFIFGLLKPQRIGVSLNENNIMMPQKSMAGIIGVGKKNLKSCGNCVIAENCRFLKEGSRCYRSEKK